MTDTLPISQLPNGQTITAVSAAAVISLDRCNIGLNTPKDAAFNVVSASAMFTTAIYATNTRSTTVSATTPINVNSGGTGLSSVSAYSILCGGTTNTGVFQGVSTQGTSGQILTSNGANALPTWQAAGGGAWTLLSTQAASTSASIIFNSTYITSTYKQYRLEIIDYIPSTDATDLILVVSEDNGANYKTGGTDYGSTAAFSLTSGALAGQQNANIAYIPINGAGNGIGSASGESLSAAVTIYNPLGSTVNKRFFINTTSTESNGAQALTITSACYKGSINPINNIKLSSSSGNMATGTFKLYGIS